MIYLICILISVFLNACGKESDVSLLAPSERVNFADLSTKQASNTTKGSVIDDATTLQDVDGARFGAMMYHHPIGESFIAYESTPNYMFNLPFKYIPTLSVWEHDNPSPIVWPDPHEGLSFFTYYPYIEDGNPAFFPDDSHPGKTSLSILSDKTKVGSPRLEYIAGEDVTFHQDVMIGEGAMLYNRVQPAYDGGYLPPVSFQFKHVLSSVIFARAVNNTVGAILGDQFRFRVTNIKISGLYAGGEFEMQEGASTDALKLKTPVKWSFIPNFSQDQSFTLNAGDELKKAAEPEPGLPQSGQGELVFNPGEEVSEVDIISYDNGIMLIPPQEARALSITVSYDLYQNWGSSTAPDWRQTSDVVHYNLAQTFQQGERYRFDVIYNYIGPVEGEINIIGKVIPWNNKDIDIPPYF